MARPMEHEEAEVEVIAPPIADDNMALAVLNRSEIAQQIATARQFRRSIKSFRDEALQLATLDEATAGECIYALPRGGKTIEGPSARFAEIINYAWGNTRAGARAIGEDDEFTTSQGVFYDLEKNTAISYEVKRRITDRNGDRFNTDMVGVTSNAAASIALRNAILKGIPKALWYPIYEAARKVIAGDMRTLVSRRDAAVKECQLHGATPEMVLRTLGVGGVQDITIDHLVTLKGILTAIKEGDTTPEQAFGNPGGQDDSLAQRSASRMRAVVERSKATTAPANPPQPVPPPEQSAETGASPTPSATEPPLDAEAGVEKIVSHQQQQHGLPGVFADKPRRKGGSFE